MKFTIILAIIVLLLNKLIGYYMPKNNTKIIDLGHNILPRFPENLNDAVTGLTFIAALFYRNVLLKGDYLKYITTMYFFRSLTIFLTILPQPAERDKCNRSIRNNCNDFLYSGHTILNVVTSYFIGYPMWPIWPIITSLITIGSLSHYSVDVLLSWLIFFSLKMRI